MIWRIARLAGSLVVGALALVGGQSVAAAATHWVAPSGAAAWSSCVGATALNGTSACSISTAFANATAGDLVYFRGGTYTTSGNFNSSHHGTGDAESQRVVFRAYPGETPNIVNTNTGQGTLMVDHNYWWFDGLTVHSTFNNAANGDRGVVYAGYDSGTTGLKVTNCHLVIDYTATGDNVDCCLLKSTDYAVIQNNLLEGYSTAIAGGVILFNGIGNKVLNNEIRNIGIGIYQKHPNCDTSYATSPEIAYNYVHDIGPSNDGGLMGRGCYTNIHDNIVSNPSGKAVSWGSNGGGACANDGHVIFNHNTLLGTFLTTEEGAPNSTVRNNIITRTQFEAPYGSWDYNIYLSAGAIGAHDQLGSVTFSGGSSPTTVAGFALTTASNGKADGDDGKDLGADVTLVGMGGVTPPVVRTITATAPANGTVSPSGTISVADGGTQSITMAASSGFSVSNVIVDGVSQGALTSYTFSNVTVDHSISFTVTASPARVITASAGTNGSVSPVGAVTVTDGGSQTFTVTPAANYHVSSVFVDGVSIGAVTSYTFSNVAADHTISVTFAAGAAAPPTSECDDWNVKHPEWIFCDDFEDGTALVRSGRYFDLSAPDSGGSFGIVDGAGYDSSKGLSSLFVPGNSQHGSLGLIFGRNPIGSNGIRTTQDFREIYYRIYVKLQPGWSGHPDKLSRAIVFSNLANWGSAMMAHVWSTESDYLYLEPTSCTVGGTVQCDDYNQVDRYQWLGLQRGTTPIFDGQASHNGKWHSIETHVKLNDPGQSNGIFEFWINGNLEARSTSLNFVGSFSAYGINAVFFENYGCGSCTQSQYRYFDNIVVSTAKIGTAESAPKNLRVVLRP